MYSLLWVSLTGSQSCLNRLRGGEQTLVTSISLHAGRWPGTQHPHNSPTVVVGKWEETRWVYRNLTTLWPRTLTLFCLYRKSNPSPCIYQADAMPLSYIPAPRDWLWTRKLLSVYLLAWSSCRNLLHDTCIVQRTFTKCLMIKYRTLLLPLPFDPLFIQRKKIISQWQVMETRIKSKDIYLLYLWSKNYRCSMIERLPGACEALSLIPRATKELGQ